MLYQEFECAEPLRPYVLCYWKFDVDAAPLTVSRGTGSVVTEAEHHKPPSFAHFILPDCCPSLFAYSLPHYQIQSTGLLGPSRRVLRKDVFYGSKTVGVRFRPTVIEQVTGICANEIRDKTLVPPPIMGQLVMNDWLACIANDTHWIEWLNKSLLSLPWQKPLPDSAVRNAAGEIMQARGDVSISSLIAKSELSERQLQKRFRHDVGLTMKEFALTMRIRASVIGLTYEGQSYQDVLAQGGYFDQAHFLRDFSRISDINLPEFKRYVRQIEHRELHYRE